MITVKRGPTLGHAAGIVAVTLALAALAAGCTGTPAGAGRDLGDLHDIGQLRSVFNRNAGKPRLILLLSPTCPTCVVGASWVRQHVLADHPRADLAVIVVWLPQFPGDERSRWDPTVLAGRRTTHFWDQDSISGRWFKDHVKLSYDTGPVLWDAYLLYGPQAHWSDVPGPLISTGRTVIGSTAQLEHDLQPLLTKSPWRIQSSRPSSAKPRQRPGSGSAEAACARRAPCTGARSSIDSRRRSGA